MNVIRSEGAVGNIFKVSVNDSTVIDKAAGFFTGDLDADGSYRNHPVRLIVTYNPGFLGIGSGFHAVVLIDNELVAKFKF